MKRLALLFIGLFLSLGLFGMPAFAEDPAESFAITATPTSSRIYVDGSRVYVEAYNIYGNNYFKLRDIASALSSTDKRFDVLWDDTNSRVLLISGVAYIGAGSAEINQTEAKEANITGSWVYLDGITVDLSFYHVGGNNYYRLRDIAQVIDFAVDWDEAGNTIRIDTGRGYHTTANDARQSVHTLVFPSSDRGKTEYNAAIYDITPFTVDMELPVGWTVKERESNVGFGAGIAFDVVWSVLDILQENGDTIGAIGYNIYEPYERAEDDPRAIYGQIALGNGYHFDVRDSYTVVREIASGTTATADVYYSASYNNGKEKQNRGIVSYNSDLSVYVAIEFDRERTTEEQVKRIAGSIHIRSANPVSLAGYIKIVGDTR